jgi:N-acetylmuramoyl-L-alanine amidase
MKQNLTKVVRLVTFFLGSWLIAQAIIATTGIIKLPSYEKEILVEIPGPTVQQMLQVERDLDCLARNIYWEARSESFEGMVAVAQVTLNRVAHKSFPDDICDVVYQGPTKASWKDKSVYYPVKHRCQFSWYCDGKPDDIATVNMSIFDQCYEVAKKVLIDKFRLPRVNNAIFYHADYVDPGWRKPRLTKIGRHIFYGDRNAIN